MSCMQFLIEEKCITRHYQDNIGIPTNFSTRDTQRVEDVNNISRIRIQIHERIT